MCDGALSRDDDLLNLVGVRSSAPVEATHCIFGTRTQENFELHTERELLRGADHIYLVSIDPFSACT